MKKNVKKIILILLLILIIGGIVFVAINASSGKKEVKISSNSKVEKVDQSNKKTKKNENTVNDETNVSTNVTDEGNNGIENANTVIENNRNTKNAKVETLSDGIKYSIVGEKIKPDIVVGDNYFANQVLDMSVNFDKYEGKTVEIEGLYFINSPYTFVGRYSTSVVCPTCPAGISYFEYEWHGDKEIKLTDEQNWLKVIGTLKKGNDGVEYYYIDVASLEVMNEKGLDTVEN